MRQRKEDENKREIEVKRNDKEGKRNSKHILYTVMYKNLQKGTLKKLSEIF